MIDAKRAVQVAEQYAADMLAKTNSNLEEIERELYEDRDVWSITP